jgi:hypothetical protein
VTCSPARTPSLAFLQSCRCTISVAEETGWRSTFFPAFRRLLSTRRRPTWGQASCRPGWVTGIRPLPLMKRCSAPTFPLLWLRAEITSSSSNCAGLWAWLAWRAGCAVRQQQCRGGQPHRARGDTGECTRVGKRSGVAGKAHGRGVPAGRVATIPEGLDYAAALGLNRVIGLGEHKDVRRWLGGR